MRLPLILLLCLLPVLAGADASRCHAIKDADKRNHCLATAKHQPSRCHAIRDADSRNQCLATTQKHKSRCHSIRDRDERNRCLARF
ncbi:MAG: hypothetical protein WDA10_11255 [Porticoccaceae bacterium]|nr:hypothetical protein [Pseudomonadota bacterium]